MITLAAFDMAGTTINDGGAVYRALERAVAETGVPVAAADLQTWMGTEKRAAITALIELGGGDPRHPTDKVETAYQRFRAILSELYAEVPPTPIEGVADAIAQLRAAGISVALTTGFSRDIATRILSEIGWGVAAEGADAPVVDALVCGDEVAVGRPAPYMIHRAMEQTGTVSTGTVLVAGDTVVDVRAGANSGAAVTIGVLTGELVREDFAEEPATELLGSVAEIPAYLSQHELWPSR
ncbi:MAG: phosphonatase-like hydrolase [Actinobacteria bacterium]|nr:phosphonatase-like hydrolase [Actinomycetota bacterium]